MISVITMPVACGSGAGCHAQLGRPGLAPHGLATQLPLTSLSSTDVRSALTPLPGSKGKLKLSTSWLPAQSRTGSPVDSPLPQWAEWVQHQLIHRIASSSESAGELPVTGYATPRSQEVELIAVLRNDGHHACRQRPEIQHDCGPTVQRLIGIEHQPLHHPLTRTGQRHDQPGILCLVIDPSL